MIVLQHRNPRECWKSKWNDCIKQAVDYQGNFWGSEYFLWFSSKHFNKFEHEGSECKTCSTPCYCRTKSTVSVSFFRDGSSCKLQTPVFKEVLSQEIKFGSMVKILRPKFRISLMRKKYVSQELTSRWCVLTVFIFWPR